MSYRELMRMKLLEDVYNKMSDEEKRTFAQILLQQKDNGEIIEAMQRQQSQLDRIEKGQNWKVDFLSDVGANFLTDGLIWFGRKIFGRL